jgi:hypothetical protein
VVSGTAVTFSQSRNLEAPRTNRKLRRCARRLWSLRLTYYNWRGQPMPESAPEQGRIAGTAAGGRRPAAGGETMTAPAGDTSVSGEGGGDLLIGSSGDNRLWITDPQDIVQEQPTAGSTPRSAGPRSSSPQTSRT